ncbi:MAG: DUF2071 domain-containing protein [Bacteroidota bacterium]
MAKGIFLSATWEYLAMFNYEVDPNILETHLPPYTELDYYKGKALVSVVGFLFNNTRVLGIRWPGHVHFEEVNLRYYVKRFDENKWKRGVAFISEIVPKYMIASLANSIYNEHYSVAQMDHMIEIKPGGITAEYNWKKAGSNWNKLSVTCSPILRNIVEGSEEEFIFEHYYGYNKLNASTTIEYSLNHPVWQVYPVTDFTLDCDIEKLYGKAFVPFIQHQKPHSVFLARGSDVQVRMPVRIKK